jgi:hypothetical protein
LIGGIELTAGAKRHRCAANKSDELAPSHCPSP